jgi:sulfatase maturation enzyme AslB (radical SAM superfamily)
MNIHTLAKRVRNLRNRVQIDVNRTLGRTFIPHHAGKLCIETSSLCNLACKFCPYDKKASPRVTMADEFFFDCVEQAVDMGFDRFELTPCTGDVFMDKGILRKLAFLDEHPRVASYSFFTNFTIPSRVQIERLLQLSKLKSIKISVYGHDLQSFLAITKSTEKVYRRFVRNLEMLHERVSDARFAMSFGLRTTGDGDIRGTSELQRVLGRFQDQGIRVGKKYVFNNWGGSITSADVEGLDIEVTDTSATYKMGACTLLFTGVQVMATGIVNGCACRDTEATLRIGDLNGARLADILSVENPDYVALIREQQAGEFRPVCQGCDFYKSIYRTTTAARNRGRSPRKLEEFLVDAHSGASST